MEPPSPTGRNPKHPICAFEHSESSRLLGAADYGTETAGDDLRNMAQRPQKMAPDPGVLFGALLLHRLLQLTGPFRYIIRAIPNGAARL